MTPMPNRAHAIFAAPRRFKTLLAGLAATV